MRNAAVFTRQVLVAAALFVLAAPVSAAYYSFQGQLEIQSTFGKECMGLKPTQAVTLTLSEAGPGGPIEGYMTLPELLSAQRVSGSDLAQLHVDLPLDPSVPHPDYQLSLQGSPAAVTGGQQHSDGDYAGATCFLRAATLTLLPSPADPVQTPQHRFAQDAALFDILRQTNVATALTQQKQFAQAISTLKSAQAAALSAFAADGALIIERVTVLLATTEQAGGDLEGAVESYRQALALDEQLSGARAPTRVVLLEGQGRVLEQLRRGKEAEPLYRSAMDITERQVGQQHIAYLNASGFLANLLLSEGRYIEAEPLYRQMLETEEKADGPAHKNTAAGTNNLALVLAKLGRYAEAEPLYRNALELNERALGPEDASVAVNLINLAEMYMGAARFAEAEPLLRRALEIRERTAGAQSALTAYVLDDLGTDLRGAERYAEAEPLYRRALAIHEQLFGEDKPIVAGDLQLLSMLLYTTGRYGEAEPLMRRSLAIDEQVLGPDAPAVASQLNDLAWLLRYTGRLSEAEALSQRALAIDEKALGAEHPQVATDLVTLAGLMLITHRYSEAETLDKRALAIREKAFGPSNGVVATTLNNLSNVYKATTRYGEAEPLLRRALAIDEQIFGEEASSTARNLQNLAGVLSRTGRRDEALPLLQRAFRIARSNGAAPQVWDSPTALMDYYSAGAPAQAPLAIYYGKVAVNTLQQLRGNLGGASSDTQTSFVDSVAPIYRRLADRLVQAGRLGEAQQVLAMLKEQELYNYTERSAETDARGTVASLTPAEQLLQESTSQWVSLSKEYEGLKQRYKSEGEAFKKSPDFPRLVQLRSQVDAAQASYDAAGASIALQASADRAQRVDDFGVGFQDTLRELGHGAVLAQYFILDDKVEILLTTPQLSLAREAPIPRAELNKAINDFRQTLISRSDPLPQAQALYRLLIGPIEQDLQQAGTQTLMLSLDDTLRYLPFAALHDGHGYLIERYALSLVTEAARGHLVDRAANNSWQVWGLGVTHSHDEGPDKFPALPMVGAELSAIAGPNGILPGELLLDPAFDANALRDGLDRSFSIIHIASHFKFDPANADDSFLLLGDGNHLSLKQIGKMNFSNVELLTLSACETALGGPGSDSHGAEVESLGAIAQKRGARAVLATLWPVADSSTALLMRTLYQDHQQHQDKAEALRQAQLALLHGTIQVSSLPETVRSAISLAGGPRPPPAATMAIDPKAPYAHPFFWAPFILMGSWQ